MSVLARLVIRSVLGYTLIVMAVLMLLSGLYLFITQQDDIGVGNYTLADAFLYVALNLPQYAFELFPIGALIGALLGLGNLARSSELVVMRASGVSPLRIAGWSAMAGIVLAALTWGLGEYVAPPLEQYAREHRAFAKFQEISLTGGRNAWAKDGNTFIAAQQQSAENRFGGVYVVEFDEQRRLVNVGRAASASVGDENRWTLENYVGSRFEGDRVIPETKARSELSTRLSPDFLGLAIVNPDSLPARALYQYVIHLRANGLESGAYEVAFWARIARTAALIVVVMLAVPFAFGPMRSTGTGARTVVGILIGAGFFLLSRMLESGGAVFNLPPLAIAWGPTVLLAILTIGAIARVR
ncbi:MAG TPA: LPS export ABC transporter permease LptG [Steroidobacteraceae bacterium]|nr:LPS export ABC transporter permease LptG [Steroidobacteraceae bacterium]